MKHKLALLVLPILFISLLLVGCHKPTPDERIKSYEKEYKVNEVTAVKEVVGVSYLLENDIMVDQEFFKGAESLVKGDQVRLFCSGVVLKTFPARCEGKYVFVKEE